MSDLGKRDENFTNDPSSADEKLGRVSENAETAENLALDEGSEDSFESSTLFSKPDPSKYGKKKKNKQLRRLIGGVVSVALLVGLLFGIKILLPEKQDDDGVSSDSGNNEIQVIKHELNDIKSVEVTSETGLIKALSYEDSASSASASSGKADLLWTLDGYDKKYLDSAAIAGMVTAYTQISATREMETTGRSLADFGLEAPKNQAVVSKLTGESYTVLIGNEAPTKDGVYVKISDSDKVYLASVELSTQSMKKPEDFAATQMIEAVKDTTDNTSSEPKADPYFNNGALSRFDRLVLGGSVRPKEIKLTYDDTAKTGLSPYLITEPRKTSADDQAVSKLIAPMGSGLSAAGVYALNVNAAKIKEYGLDKPLSTIYYEVKSSKVLLKIAAVKDDNANYAVMVNDIPVIYKVAKTSLEFAEWTGPDLYAKLLFLADITTVKSIDAQYGGKTHTFELTHIDDEEAEENLVVKADGKAVNVSDFRDFYQVIIGITDTEYTDITPPTEAPSLKITFKYLDGKTKNSELKFTKVSERRYWYEVEGMGEVLVSTEKYNDIIKGLDKYFK